MGLNFQLKILPNIRSEKLKTFFFVKKIILYTSMTAFLRWFEIISGSGVTNRVESDGNRARSSGPAPEKKELPPEPKRTPPESRRSPPRE
jgi:hypothetical protein